MRPIAIGVSDFKYLIEKGALYVDKTLFIKEIIDDFHKWWWNKGKNPLKYAANPQEYKEHTSSVGAVLLLGGGMCNGLGNYYFKCLQAQDIPNLKRVGFHLKDALITKKGTPPKEPEFWGAMIVTHFGLGMTQIKEDEFLPVKNDPSIYRSTGVRILKPILEVPW